MKLSAAREPLTAFRSHLYACFPKRADAIMNLLDALTCHGRECNSVVQLCNTPAFERQYSSITDAIADGLPHADWSAIQSLLYQQREEKSNTIVNRFIMDCTGNPRKYARKLADRHITHTPNPAPGNKPIAVGHQYSVLTLLPTSASALEKHWLLPLSAQRVQSHQKGNEVGMSQLSNIMNSLGLTDQMSVSIGDSLYGTERCRVAAAKHDNLVHIFRLNSKRNVFCAPVTVAAESRKKGKAGRHKEFGAKMNLGIPNTHPPSDQQATTEWISRRGKKYLVTIDVWNNMLLRGSRSFRSSEHPMNVIRITVIDEDGKPLYKRPLWLAVFGKRRHEISLVDVYESYRSRYDIEHFYRFSKRNLLMDAYQTPDVDHEELWWSLCLLAYIQLYLAKDIVPTMPQPWERYLPVYKNNESTTDSVSTPSQTQRGFSQVLDQIGTPAKPCIARGKPRGRIVGDLQEKRVEQPVIFKSGKLGKNADKQNLLTSGSAANLPNPQKIEQLIQMVQLSLGKLEVSPSEFSKMLFDST